MRGMSHFEFVNAQQALMIYSVLILHIPFHWLCLEDGDFSMKQVGGLIFADSLLLYTVYVHM